TITSGSNLDKVEFNVFSATEEGMDVRSTEKVIIGDLLKMWMSASHKTSIIIEIVDTEGKIVQELTCNTTKEFKCETFWSIPKDTIPGTYTIKTYDAISSNETTFEIIMK
ncbi:MAG: biofilm-associated protein, partial [Nitrosopumilus sp.]